jgi:hypothetical protein
MRTLIGHVAMTVTATALCLGVTSPGWAAKADDEPAGAREVEEPGDPPAIVENKLTGRWRGSFKTTSRLAPQGEFVFDLKESDANHAVSGPFTGTVTKGIASGTAFKGRFTGVRSGSVLNGTVAITEPSGVSGDFKFQDAAIGGGGGNQITGKFAIAVKYSLISIDATGGYSIAR